jgi:putative DNA primase/helicase
MVDPLKLRMEREKHDREEAAKRHRASIIALSAVNRAKPLKHSYLERKGFPDAIALVLENELIVPMWNFKTNKLTSIQRINGHGEKKFLAGGETKGAVFIIGKKRYPAVKILCEGYATALSIKAAADAMHKSCEVWVCFSASNLVYVAERIGGERVVVADNDASKTGQNAARSTGLPWLMSPVEGDDFNDYHQREGLWAAVKLLRVILQKEAA